MTRGDWRAWARRVSRAHENELMRIGVWQPKAATKDPFPDGSRRWNGSDAGGMLRASAGLADTTRGPPRTYLKYIGIKARADHAHATLPALNGGWWWMGPTSSVPVRTAGGVLEYLHEECPLCRYRSAMPDVHVVLGKVDGEPVCSGDRRTSDDFLARVLQTCQEHPRRDGQCMWEVITQGTPEYSRARLVFLIGAASGTEVALSRALADDFIATWGEYSRDLRRSTAELRAR